VLGVWPLHGLCGAWGGIAAGIFGSAALGGLGTVSMAAQLIGTLGGVVVAFVGGYLIYSAIRQLGPLRLDAEEEYEGADLSIHKITATPDREVSW
jgi:Amt family ammonium transporter